MPWNTSGSVSGAAQGASAGGQMGGGWGALIGGVLGAGAGGMQTVPDVGNAPQIGPTRYPGAVSSPYGSMIYDPITGSTRYVQNTNTGSYNPSTYQDAALYDALMGGNAASSGLSQQIQAQQLMLDQLKAQGGGKAPTAADFHLRTDDKGNILNATDFINKNNIGFGFDPNGQQVPQGQGNPFWEDFIRQTGGKFGGTDGEIAYAKWAREVDRNAANDLGSYENAKKTYESNASAANNAIQQQELQLAQMRALAGEPGMASASVSQNPLLLALQQQEAEANSPYYLKSMNAQTQGTYDNQLQAQQQQLAARGLGASGLAEMTRARMGLQLGNQFNQNALAANQMTTDKRQAALNNRMNMLNFLSGRKDTGFNQGMQKEQLGMQQVGLGSGYGMQNIGNAAQRDIAQLGLNSQYNLANANFAAQNANQNSRNWSAALGGIGAGIDNYNDRNPSTTTNSTGYIDQGGYDPYETPDRSGGGSW